MFIESGHKPPNEAITLELNIKIQTQMQSLSAVLNLSSAESVCTHRKATAALLPQLQINVWQHGALSSETTGTPSQAT